MPPLHDDELAIDVALVRRLVAKSLPQYDGLPVQSLPTSGSSNALFRLGDGLLARLPRQAGGSVTIQKEACWLPLVAAGVSTAVPEVVAVAPPGFGYPETWSVQVWLDGCAPAVRRDATTVSSRPFARDLARFVAELRQIPVPASAAADPALSWYRGGPLRSLDSDFREAVAACRDIAGLDLDLRGATEVWDRALEAERTVDPVTTWYHGDLFGENLLVSSQRLVAVLDFGGLAVGDPTVDLAGAWEVLDTDGRRTFRAALGVDDATWLKGMGWALLVAVITFPNYWRTMPARCADRLAMATAVLDDARLDGVLPA